MSTGEARPGYPVPATEGYRQALSPGEEALVEKGGGKALPAPKPEQEEGQEGAPTAGFPWRTPAGAGQQREGAGAAKGAGTD